MNTTKRFIVIFITSVALLFLVVASLNYFVDPLNLFSDSEDKSLEAKLARSLVVHQNIVTTNMDERKFQLYRIKYEQLEPEVIIVGASRVMQIGKNSFDKNSLNLGVSGATIEDHVALLDLATIKFKPKMIIIGTDPWIFNSASGQKRWQSLRIEYENAVTKIQPEMALKQTISVGFYDQLINYAYTKESLGELYKRYTNTDNDDVQYVESDAPLQDRDIIRKDGSRVYNKNYADRTQEDLAADIDGWIEYSMSSYYDSEKLLNTFIALLDYYNKKYEVILLLSPYHPLAYKKILEKKQ
ncbi:MAG: hypothetical protein VYC67_04090, partial [Pseudomonadota bacterium]|nr:hypothetical protein [Pseudomonadota bacterium]